MKRILVSLLTLILLLSALPAFAEASASTGIWEKRAYVDEFDLPTDDYYISNARPFTGKFSNSATTDSELLAYVYIDKYQNSNVIVSFKLIEYGDHIVKNSYSEPISYDVAMMDVTGEKHYFTAHMPGSSEMIYFKSDDAKSILSLLCANGTVRFVFTRSDNSINKYSLVFETSDTLYAMLPIKSIGSFSSGMAPVCNILDKYGYINTDGETVIPCIYEPWYDIIYDFSNGVAPVYKDGQFALIDTTGAIVVPFGEYESFGPFADNLSVVKKNGKYGYIDTTGTLVIPCIYNLAFKFSDGLASVYTKDEGLSCIDTSGTKVFTLENFDISGGGLSFSDGLACYRDSDSGKYGYIDKTGTLVLPCEYDMASPFHEGYATVLKENQQSIINLSGTPVLSDCGWPTFSYGLAAISSGNKYGYIDLTGNVVIPYQFDVAYEFSDGIAKVIINDAGGMKKQGFIDINGGFIIPCEYDVAAYGEGFFALMKNDNLTVIPREEIQPGWEDEVAAYEAGLEEQREAAAAEAEGQKMLVEYTDKDTVKAVQAALNEAGFPCGTPDGAAGKKTIAAITDYQTANGLTVTGTITHETLISLGLAE